MRAAPLPSGLFVKTDGRSLNRVGGQKRRHHYTYEYKASVIDMYGNGIADGGIAAKCMSTISLREHLGSGVVSRWVGQREEILKHAGDRRRKDLARSGMSLKRGLFPKMESALHVLFLAKRKRGRKVTATWLC